MKYIIYITLSVLLFSCSYINMKPTYFTEAYIKTKLQEHIKEEVSTISIKSKYKLYSNEGIEIIEYNFITYNDKLYFSMTFNDLLSEKPNIIILNKEECKKLLPKIVEIVYNAKSTQKEFNNIDYFDYSVRENVFFSAINNNGEDFQNFTEKSSTFLYIWIGVNKYRLDYNILLKLLEEFNTISR